MTLTQASPQRIQWVDAMRGFSMIVVVVGHVLVSMGIGGYDSFLGSLLLTFRMPLFFFVSGFFSFRAIEWWNKTRVFDILKRKFQAQIICTVIFASLCALVFQGKVNFAGGFGGYWFTIVLFQMYIIYLALSLFSRLINKNIVIPALIIISVAFVGILAVYSRESRLWHFLTWENLTKYMQFFTLGIICSKYRERFWKILENRAFTTLMISGWIICLIIIYLWGGYEHLPSIIRSLIHDIAVRYCGLMTVVIMFFGGRTYFSQNSQGARILRFIGQRTLDIYMIHYFLIPRMADITPWIKTGNTFIFQLGISVGVSALIIAVCLLISSILRHSSVLAAWLFGVRQRPTRA